MQKEVTNNIEFVSISVDKANLKDKWKQTIVDREMTGVQLFAGKTQDELDFTCNLNYFTLIFCWDMGHFGMEEDGEQQRIIA